MLIIIVGVMVNIIMFRIVDRFFLHCRLLFMGAFPREYPAAKVLRINVSGH
jgi:hypothetical protein